MSPAERLATSPRRRSPRPGPPSFHVRQAAAIPAKVHRPCHPSHRRRLHPAQPGQALSSCQPRNCNFQNRVNQGKPGGQPWGLSRFSHAMRSVAAKMGLSPLPPSPLPAARGCGKLTIMEHEFTSAASRALARAAAWLDRNDCKELSGPALLLGLLAEPECRAALRLARDGIDAAAVRARWAQLGDSEIVSICGDIPPPADVAPFEPLLFAVGQRLADFPPPLVFATEHLLLGLVAAEDETSHWLRRQGIDGDALRDEICRLYGYDADPAPLAAGQCACQPEAPARDRETLPERPSLALRAGIGRGYVARRIGRRPANPRRRRESRPRRTPRDGGLRPLRAGRSPLDRATEAAAARTGRGHVAAPGGPLPRGARDPGRRGHDLDHPLGESPRGRRGRGHRRIPPPGRIAPHARGVRQIDRR